MGHGVFFPAFTDKRMSTSVSFTRHLTALRQGDAEAADRLFACVYAELCRLAHKIRRSRAPTLFDTTALVHEAYLHLQPLTGLDVRDRRHFYRLAARAMRQVLAREARHRQAQKRGGDVETISLHGVQVGGARSVVDVITIEQALDALDRRMPRPAQVVRCRLYAGLSVGETARALDISSTTVKRDWRAARAWLRAHLAPPGE
jgi:RNA polymerase sigma factor (TIGR02999 family)